MWSKIVCLFENKTKRTKKIKKGNSLWNALENKKYTEKETFTLETKYLNLPLFM